MSMMNFLSSFPKSVELKLSEYDSPWVTDDDQNTDKI